MRVLMLSWEFPPRIISGTASRVYNLSKSLAEGGTDVHVATCDFPNALSKEKVDGIRVSRVNSSGFPDTDFLLWVINLNSMMIDKGDAILRNEGPFDLIHVHDWVLAMAAVELRNRYSLPLVTSIHATVFGRHGEESRGYRKNVRSLEQFLALESNKVICHSSYVLNQLTDSFELPEDKKKTIEFIPDDTDERRLVEQGHLHDPSPAKMSGPNKSVLYVGDLVRTNGVVTLIDAIAKLRQQGIDVDLTVVGDGPYRGDLMAEVYAKGMQKHISFMGAVDQETLLTLYKLSDVVTIPSLYERSAFVVVAALASLIPVVASDMGGISEIVENGMTGINVPPNDSNMLAKAVFSCLVDNSSYTRTSAPRTEGRCDWGLVSGKTLKVYEGAILAAGKPAGSKTRGL
jgi:glycogen(starch) synthase